MFNYPPIPGTRLLPYSPLPAIGSEAIPQALRAPNLPSPGSKSIFAFWHSGIESLPGNLLRNVIAWHRRYSPLGWTIYVLNTVPGSLLNVGNLINTTAPDVVPAAFTSNTLDGEYAGQHTSDLIRFPLLLKYGGVYLDVGILQFGDLEWLWGTHIANPASVYDFAGFTMGDGPEQHIVNFAFMCQAENPLLKRAHSILLKVWEGKTNTTGMHAHPLLSHVPLMRVPEEVVHHEEISNRLAINDAAMTDYAIQIQCISAAQGWSDVEEGWNGPQYVKEKCWLLNMVDSAFMHDQLTGWNGQRQFDLLRLKLPSSQERETEDQKLAREMVQTIVEKSWCLKLGHGFSAKLFGCDTLGMLWRRHDGSDCEMGTYAGWLREAEIFCVQESPPEPLVFPESKATVVGKLM